MTFSLVMLVVLTNLTQAQITHVSGNFAVGSLNVFRQPSDPEGSDSCIPTWTITGGAYTIMSATPLELQVIFTAPATSVSVYVRFVICTTRTQYVFYPTFEVVEPRENYNFVRETGIRKSGIVTSTQTSALNAAERAVTTNYFDGLGRPMQQVIKNGSPLQRDLVQPIVYDQYGRETSKYLPYSSTETNGYFKENTVISTNGSYNGSAHYNFYNGSSSTVSTDAAAFSTTIMDNSPLNRALKQGAPGAAWQPDTSPYQSPTDHAQAHSYEVNEANEVLLWTYTPPSTGFPLGLINSGTAAAPVYFASNQLYRNRTKDEEHHEVIEYLDKEGHTLLKRIQVVATNPLTVGATKDTDYASTYFIYDNAGNLVCVVPPEATKEITKATSEYYGKTDAVKEAFLSRWTFRYKYDPRKRISVKQEPGLDSVCMVYDKRNRLVFVQDGIRRSLKQWVFTKYDVLDRPIITGIKDTAVVVSRLGMQGVIDNFYATKAWSKWGETYIGDVTGAVHGYSNKSYPVVTTAATVDVSRCLTIIYYDNYTFRNDWLGNYAYDATDALSATMLNGTFTQPVVANSNVTSLVTGTKIKVLDGGVTGGYTWLKSVTYYDDRYRLIQTQADNYKGGKDQVSHLYDFVGVIIKSKETHIERDVTWQNVAGATRIGNKLVRTAASNNWTGSGAASKQQLPAGQDGWVELMVSEINTNRMIGLAATNPDLNFTSINYAFYLSSAILAIYESGVKKISFAALLKPGDILRIQRTGTAVKYFRNGSELYPNGAAVTQTPSTTSLLVDASLNTAASTLVNVTSSFSTSSRTITRRLVYDHASRVKEIWHQLDAQPEVRIAFNTFNELGQLVDKKLHSTATNATDAKQSVDYRYTIRGWLSTINNSQLTTDNGLTNDDTGDYFGMNLFYHTADASLNNTGLFNGNLSGMKWSNKLGLSDTTELGYTFQYDPLNRLLGATSRMKTTSWSSGFYDENGLAYDLNGNIKSLQRKGMNNKIIDNLTYNYGASTTLSNRLLYVQDNAPVADNQRGFIDGHGGLTADYKYDVNGNLNYDLNKGIGATLMDATNRITYNYLNLPETIVKSGNSIRYIYDATGHKLTQVTSYGTAQKQTDYVGEFIYENDVLQYINHEEGRVVMDAPQLIYADHGESVATMTAASATLATYVNNAEKYIQVTSSGTTVGTGVFPIGGMYPVQPGERYRIRAKGYSDKGTAASGSAAYLQLKTEAGVLDAPGAVLPASAVTESWIEQQVTIPAGATTLQAGMAWNTVLAGEVMYINEFEITQLASNTWPEYQYNLVDHLGNVRVAFTSKQDIENTTATLETENANAESGQFVRYDNARLVKHYWFDHTKGSSPSTVNGQAQRLSGVGNEIYGLGRSLSVMPGDVINMEVYAKYIDKSTSNWKNGIATVLSQIASGATGIVTDGANYSSSTASFPFPVDEQRNVSNSTGTGPKAYLSWLVYDRNYNFIAGQSGYKRMSTDAKENGQDAAHEKLFGTLTVKEPGYVYIFVSNEEGTNPYEVYFDDFNVIQTKSSIIQAQDFYPFGLTYNEYARENALDNKQQYNGKEKQDELGLGMLDYGARMYDPAIGRWKNVDPLTEKMPRYSPYNYAFDNPIRFIDLDGRKPEEPDEDPDGRNVYYSNIMRAALGLDPIGDKSGGNNNESEKGQSKSKETNQQKYPEGYVDARLNAFINTYFKTEINKIKNNKLKIRADYQFTHTTMDIPGITVPFDDVEHEEGTISIYINPLILLDDNNAKLTYLIIGHELVHGLDQDSGIEEELFYKFEKSGSRNIMEYHAYRWSVQAEKRLNEHFDAEKNLDYYSKLLPANFEYSTWFDK